MNLFSYPLNFLLKFAAVLLLVLCGLASAADSRGLACIGARVYPSPTDPPIEKAILLIDDGKVPSIAFLKVHFVQPCLILKSEGSEKRNSTSS